MLYYITLVGALVPGGIICRLAVYRDCNGYATIWHGTPFRDSDISVKCHLIGRKTLICNTSQNKNPCFVLMIYIPFSARDRSCKNYGRI